MQSTCSLFQGVKWHTCPSGAAMWHSVRRGCTRLQIPLSKIWGKSSCNSHCEHHQTTGTSAHYDQIFARIPSRMLSQCQLSEQSCESEIRVGYLEFSGQTLVPCVNIRSANTLSIEQMHHTQHAPWWWTYLFLQQRGEVSSAPGHQLTLLADWPPWQCLDFVDFEWLSHTLNTSGSCLNRFLRPSNRFLLNM